MDFFTNFFDSGSVNKQALVTTIMTLYGAGLATYLFKDIPSKLWGFIVRQLTTSVTITSKDDIFWYFQNIIFLEGASKHARKIRFSDARCFESTIRARDPNAITDTPFLNPDEERVVGDNRPSQSIKVLGQGTHWVWIKHRLVQFSVSIEKNQGNEYNTITLTKLGRSHKFFDDIKQEIDFILSTESTNGNRLMIYKYFSQYDMWSLVNQVEKRSLQSVFMDENVKHQVINFITSFIKNRQDYLVKGIPHNLGILLYGPPGTGKTSFIKAIASHFNRAIYYLDPKELASAEERLNNIKRPAILVIEDIDTSTITHARNKNNKATSLEKQMEDFKRTELSSLLNTLDGLLGSEDRIMIMTTNDIDKLDEALVRPGRIDLKVEIGYVTPHIFNNFVKAFYGEDCKVKSVKQTTVAQLQNDYLRGLTKQQLIEKWTT